MMESRRWQADNSEEPRLAALTLALSGAPQASVEHAGDAPARSLAGLVLRSVRDVADAKPVLRLASRYRKRFTCYESAEDWAHSLISERDMDRDRCLLLAERGADAPVAVIELVQQGDAVSIALLVVGHHYRMAGVGRQLVRRIEVAAQNVGFRALALGVDAENTEATAFWESLGFAVRGVLGGRSHDAIIVMEKLLLGDAAEDAVTL